LVIVFNSIRRPAMSENETYRHEDIEALFMSKSFGELLSEEKAFVMQHVQSEEEYNSLRALLIEMHELSFDSELTDPPLSLETALLHGFAENAQKERGYKQRFSPWMGWAIAASLVGVCVVFFWPSSNPVEKAEVMQTADTSATNEEKPLPDKQQQTVPSQPLEAPSVVLPAEVENLLAQVVPASTPEPPSFATGLYEYEDAIKAVSLTEEASDEPQSADALAPVELDVAENQSEKMAEEDASFSAAPAVAKTELSKKASSAEEMSADKITAETKALGKANRKKSRNPDVLKLSQSKKLKALLRRE
jgi:hypothetical protein